MGSLGNGRGQGEGVPFRNASCSSRTHEDRSRRRFLPIRSQSAYRRIVSGPISTIIASASISCDADRLGLCVRVQIRPRPGTSTGSTGAPSSGWRRASSWGCGDLDTIVGVFRGSDFQSLRLEECRLPWHPPRRIRSPPTYRRWEAIARQAATLVLAFGSARAGRN